MRTTLTIDDALAQELKARAVASGKPFKQVVNETLMAGLRIQEARMAKPYRLRPVSLGAPSVGIDVTKALRLSEELEDQAILAKLEQRK
ncbi:MAG: DUF2191 domain-containing protein [Pseudomonadota bacterium]|jgi:hypothetical protein